MLDDGQIAFFYPPNLIFLIVPLDKAFGVYACVQLILAGLGAYAFAQRIGLDEGPATLAGTRENGCCKTINTCQGIPGFIVDPHQLDGLKHRSHLSRRT